MARTKIEIKVFEEVIIADGLKKAIVIIMKLFKAWYRSESNSPLNISLKKLEDRGPPTLEIKVTDKVITKSAFG